MSNTQPLSSNSSETSGKGNEKQTDKDCMPVDKVNFHKLCHFMLTNQWGYDSLFSDKEAEA